MSGKQPIILILLLFLHIFESFCKSEKNDGKGNLKVNEKESKLIINDLSDCEVCRVVTLKIKDNFKETGKHPQVIEKSYHFDDIQRPNRYLDYEKSQLRFIESTEKICVELYRINMNYEKKLNDTSRAYRYEEIQLFKSKCDAFMEKWEDRIEKWYNKGPEANQITEYLCRGIVLRKKDQNCLGKKMEVEKQKEEEKMENKQKIITIQEEDEIIN